MHWVRGYTAAVWVRGNTAAVRVRVMVTGKG